MIKVIELFSGIGSQRAALAGNCIIVDVLYYIFKSLFIESGLEK